jgi:transcriptional regulator with XRE-family HTH domain
MAILGQDMPPIGQRNSYPRADRNNDGRVKGSLRALKITLPRRLIRLRELTRSSQLSVAASCGIAPSTLNLIESGLAPDVKLSTLLKLCAFFHVSPDYLLAADTEPGRSLLDTGRHIIDRFNAGRPVEEIAAETGLTPHAVGVVIDDEISTARRRRY